MAYVPVWERLIDALRRVRAATGLSKQDAQCDICAAIGDGTIKVRPSLQLIKQTITDHMEHNRYAREITELQDNVYNGINRYPEPWELHRPFPEPLKRLKPRQLDWRRSRFKQWFLIPIRPDIAPMTWDVSIELSSAGVTKVLCRGKRAQEKPATTAGRESAAIRALAKHLKGDRHLRRADAEAWCRAQGCSFTARGFQYRIWPAARTQAGLDATAPAGRKRKP
jgi:hypothetical protein